MKKAELKRRKEMRKQGYDDIFIKSPLGELTYKLNNLITDEFYCFTNGEIIDNHDGTITIKEIENE